MITAAVAVNLFVSFGGSLGFSQADGAGVWSFSKDARNDL